MFKRVHCDVTTLFGTSLSVPSSPWKEFGAWLKESRLNASGNNPVKEPETVRELVDRLNDLGIHVELADNLIADDSPDALERVKVSLEAVLRGILTYRQK